MFLLTFSLKAQIQPFTDHDWIIEEIIDINGSQIFANQSQEELDVLIVSYSNFFSKFVFEFSTCGGRFDFDDINQEFSFLFLGCAITPNHTIIADHFVNVFILQEGGETQTAEGPVYGPFSYNFTYSGDLVYLHITNLAGSVATFYANNLNQDQFLKEAITIYPNPVFNVLNIKNVGIAIENVKIYDLNGRLIKEEKLDHNQIDLSQLQKGIYVLEIITTVGVLREKLVKN